MRLERERRAFWVARPVRARRRVVEQADAAPPVGLEGEPAARRGTSKSRSTRRSPRSTRRDPA